MSWEFSDYFFFKLFKRAQLRVVLLKLLLANTKSFDKHFFEFWHWLFFKKFHLLSRWCSKLKPVLKNWDYNIDCLAPGKVVNQYLIDRRCKLIVFSVSNYFIHCFLIFQVTLVHLEDLRVIVHLNIVEGVKPWVKFIFKFESYLVFHVSWLSWDFKKHFFENWVFGQHFIWFFLQHLNSRVNFI